MITILSDTQKRKKAKILNNINKLIKVEIPATGAAITPPLGPVLGQYGMNTMEFCKEFNEESKIFEKDTIIPTVIYLAVDKSFYFELKTPGVAYFIKKYLESCEIQRSKDNNNNNTNNFYLVEKNKFLKFLYDVSLLKLNLNIHTNNDENHKISTTFIQNYIRSMLGTSRSFGIKIF